MALSSVPSVSALFAKRLSRFAALAGLALLLASDPPVALASDPPRYERIRASPDGIGKVYLGREIAQVMSFHGAAWLERPERMTEERTDRVLAALDLKPGMTVADIGAGSGYYARRVAQAVGPGGRVYAVDVQPEMIKLLETQMEKRGVKNVTAMVGTATDPRLPAGVLDLAFMVDVYHEFEFPHEMLAALVRALKPGARIAFVEYRAGDPKVPIKPLHTMTETQVRKEAAAHPLEWVKTTSDLPWQHVIVFRRK